MIIFRTSSAISRSRCTATRGPSARARTDRSRRPRLSTYVATYGGEFFLPEIRSLGSARQKILRAPPILTNTTMGRQPHLFSAVYVMLWKGRQVCIAPCFFLLLSCLSSGSWAGAAVATAEHRISRRPMGTSRWACQPRREHHRSRRP